MPNEDLQDLAIYCLNYSLMVLCAEQPLGQLVIWREVFPTRKAKPAKALIHGYVEPEGRCFLLIVGIVSKSVKIKHANKRINKQIKEQIKMLWPNDRLIKCNQSALHVFFFYCFCFFLAFGLFCLLYEIKALTFIYTCRKFSTYYTHK